MRVYWSCSFTSLSCLKTGVAAGGRDGGEWITGIRCLTFPVSMGVPAFPSFGWGHLSYSTEGQVIIAVFSSKGNGGKDGIIAKDDYQIRDDLDGESHVTLGSQLFEPRSFLRERASRRPRSSMFFSPG